MALETFSELVNAVAKIPEVFTVGTIFTVDEAEMMCVVTPEDGGQNVEDVPLRVMRYADAIGFSIVPVVGTAVIVAWLDKSRPVIFRVHAWDKVVIQNKDGHGILINPGDVVLGVSAKAEPAVLGNKLEQRLSALEGAFNDHVHTGVTAGAANTAGPSNLVTGEPEVRTWRVKVS